MAILVNLGWVFLGLVVTPIAGLAVIGFGMSF
jgi:hypothetical protein